MSDFEELKKQIPFEELRKQIIDEKITMCYPQTFKTIDHISKLMNVNGDIVECGIWKGGMCIYMSKVFPDRTIWGFDSFEGCEDTADAKYYYYNEVHGEGRHSVDYNSVQENINKFGCKNIKLVKGYFKDILPTCEVKDIALLRIDCDAYSATLEALMNLYDKVVKGGFIIFDDYCLPPSRDAINDFFKVRKIKVELLDAETNLPIGNSKPLGPWCQK